VEHCDRPALLEPRCGAAPIAAKADVGRQFQCDNQPLSTVSNDRDDEPAQPALEGEVQARFGEAIELCQEEAPGCQRGQFRSQRGKAAGNQVAVF
jgi:hypothetical protein